MLHTVHTRKETLLVFLSLCYLIRSSLTGTSLACSEYLVSGLSGVTDDAFTASSWFDSRTSSAFSPDKARLYYEGRDNVASSGWCSSSINDNAYIQVSLQTETVIDTVILQGRGDYNQYIKSFYLLYSIDGTTWTHVNSSDGTPKAFPGNTDNTTPVKITVNPTITAIHVRINARSWNSRPCGRFDLGGCRNINIARAGSQYAMASLPSTSVLGQHIVLQPTRLTSPYCGVACHKHGKCYSFTFDGQACQGYTVLGKTSYDRIEMPYYYNTVVSRLLGYQHDPLVNLLYIVYELGRTHIDAADICMSESSNLVTVDTTGRMNVLQGVIGQNNVLKHHFRFHVSGQYGSQWQHDDGRQINVTLWSPSNPDTSQGTCVMLTQTGLSSVDCSETLFFICEY